MRHILLLSLLVYGLILAGLVTRNSGFLALAIPLIIYVAAGLLFEPERPQLTLTRMLSTDRASPGQPVSITLAITNSGPRLEEVTLADTIPASLTRVDGDTSAITTLQPGQTFTLAYTVKGGRGLYRFSEVQVHVSDYFQLFTKQLILSAPNQFFALPDVVRVKQVAIRPPRTGIYSGLIPARQGGPGVEFFGVREYQPGDPLRWINERASARHQQALFVNEFQQERVVDVGLILDARRQSDARRPLMNSARQGYESLFEYNIQAAATLADTFLDGGNKVGLFIYGRSLDWTFPGYGKLQKERINRALAQAQLGQGKIFEKLDHLPTRLFPMRSQLVFISPLLPEDTDMLIKLRARGYRILIISPDPIAFERSGLANRNSINLATRIAKTERDFTLRKLKEAEIQVIDWPVETPIHQLAHAALSRLPFQRGRTAL